MGLLVLRRWFVRDRGAAPTSRPSPHRAKNSYSTLTNMLTVFMVIITFFVLHSVKRVASSMSGHSVLGMSSFRDTLSHSLPRRVRRVQQLSP